MKFDDTFWAGARFSSLSSPSWNEAA